MLAGLSPFGFRLERDDVKAALKCRAVDSVRAAGCEPVEVRETGELGGRAARPGRSPAASSRWRRGNRGCARAAVNRLGRGGFGALEPGDRDLPARGSRARRRRHLGRAGPLGSARAPAVVHGSGSADPQSPDHAGHRDLVPGGGLHGLEPAAISLARRNRTGGWRGSFRSGRISTAARWPTWPT